jgi:hypothetical protein
MPVAQLTFWRLRIPRHVRRETIEGQMARRSTNLMKRLKGLLGEISGEYLAHKPKSAAKPNRPIGRGDFRAVEIEPSILCCAAAIHARGRPYLMREAPRLPLYGCTMTTDCSCRFIKNADRRGGDRRLFGAIETNRWFAGLDGRKQGRRSAEKAAANSL